MSIKLKVLGSFIVIFLVGCSGNSSSGGSDLTSNLKVFTGVVNNSSVKGADVAALPIGKYGQFIPADNNELKSSIGTSDEDGRFVFAVDSDELSPYVLTVSTPEENLDQSAQSSCQVVSGCTVSGKKILFGDYYSLAAKQQWSAAVESISSGQFIVVNPITDMAQLLGFSTYINNRGDSSTTAGTVAAPSYYSNYGVVKSNSQTASLFGLGDILSVEPADMSDLHLLDIASSTSIEESIRYGALLAAWQKLELAYNENLVDGDFSFKDELLSQYISNEGQLYQAAALDGQIVSLKDWYQVALINLREVRDYHLSLGRSLPGEANLVIARFESEISRLSDGVLTTAQPVILEQYLEDYSDAVMKTKAMVNYISDLKNNFVTPEYRESIKASSDLITAETRRLSPKLDTIFQQLLSIKQYYLSCTHGACDTQSIWHGNGNVFTESTKNLKIVNPVGTELEMNQALVFDEDNPEGSASTNAHDLFFSGVIQFDGLKLELSNFTSDGVIAIKNGMRLSFSPPLAEFPLPPALIVGGMGASVNEALVSDYIELVMPNFKLYDTSQEGLASEISVSGSLTALMIANTDAGDYLEGKAPEDKLGKRYNLSSVGGSLNFWGQDKSLAGSDDELRDSALIYLEATASESFVSADNFTAYFPDTVYPTFEAFFKPREGFSVGSTSPSHLVVSRRGVMNFPKLDTNGVVSDTETVLVEYIELDYELGGLQRYVVYPKIAGDDEYWGLICSALPELENDLVDPEYTRVIQDEKGNDVVQALLNCSSRDKYSGSATADGFVNKIYALSHDAFNLLEFNGQGTYRINYPTTDDGQLEVFVDGATHNGTLEKPIVLGVDSMRIQFKAKLVNPAGTDYFPESLLDISLIWREHDLITVNALLAYNPEQVVNNPNGSGLPYLAAGSNSESYFISYNTDENGNEVGEYALAWAGVNFVDGPVDGTKVMQRTTDEDLKEGVFSEIGSNVSYSPFTKRELEKLGSVDGSDVSEEKCGFFARANIPVAGEDCDAVAYFTFRGLVTGSLREERDGVYIIRYIDGSWQVLGAQ